MPEGDSVAGHARLLRPILSGLRVDVVGGTAPSVRANSHRVLSATVTGVRAEGKHLVIDLSSGYSIHVHLGLSGRWRVLSNEATVHGSARLVLTTAAGTVACYSAPTVEVDRTPVIAAHLNRLGPDVLGEFDTEEFLRRARTRNEAPLAEVLLDQRVVAGIGNVYKSELLFLEGIHPESPVAALSDERLESVADRATKLLAANVDSRVRSTTGSRARDQETWVYGREGRPCRRCRTEIAGSRSGDRITFWCPTCQPSAAAGP